MRTRFGEQNSARVLLLIKTIHTFIWAIFAGAIVAIPVATMLGALHLAFWLSALVWIEVSILLINGMRCPLTAMAARHTEVRTDNFDIYLPQWLARENKRIFGTLFALSQVMLLAWLALA